MQRTEHSARDDFRVGAGSNAQFLIEKGAPIGKINPLDYTSSAFFYFLVPKNWS